MAIFSPFFVAFFFNLLVLGHGKPKFPCFFIFGDSLVDNGNNNDLDTQAKANYLPYGIDFPEGPTGRFTNGRNIADILADLLDFDTSVPPFATAKGRKILKGVNYGSGAAGILDESGQQLGDRISLWRQLANHEKTLSSIVKLFGNKTSAAKRHLNKCLYFSNIGSNDYINNYYMPEYYTTSTKYTPDQYATLLVQQYSQQLRTLYYYGARKIAVSPVGSLGCIPAELARYPNETLCVASINDAVSLFNDKLGLLIRQLNTEFSDANFLNLGTLNPLVTNLASLGINLLTSPCCKVSNNNGQCIPGESPCLVRPMHIFYDNFHPTEIVNKGTADALYTKIQTLIR